MNKEHEVATKINDEMLDHLNARPVTDAGKAPRGISGMVQRIDTNKYLMAFNGDEPIWTSNKWRAGIFFHAEISESFSRKDKRSLVFHQA